MIADASDPHIAIRTDADIVEAIQAGRDLALRIGLGDVEATRVATAIAEVARNMLVFAGEGEIVLSTEARGRRSGVVVVARDEGPGIPDVQLALQDGYSGSGGSGLGLPTARRMMDEFEVVSTRGRGTTITMKLWARR